jgi:hypothetical protein
MYFDLEEIKAQPSSLRLRNGGVLKTVTHLKELDSEDSEVTFQKIS